MKIYPYIKRLLDIIFSFIFLLLFSPLLVILYFLFLFSTGFPVFFIQKRVTKNGKIFKMYKFRTMVKNAVQLQGKGKTDVEVITKIGKIIRPIHLDELPQLWNILKGDMSFIGYRPLLIKEYKSKQKILEKIIKTKAGLTGLSAAIWYIDKKNCSKIMKKYHFSHPEIKFPIEKYYSENFNFMLDLKIIWWTFLLEMEHLECEFKK